MTKLSPVKAIVAAAVAAFILFFIATCGGGGSGGSFSRDTEVLTFKVMDLSE